MDSESDTSRLRLSWGEAGGENSRLRALEELQSSNLLSNNGFTSEEEDGAVSVLSLSRQISGCHPGSWQLRPCS